MSVYSTIPKALIYANRIMHVLSEKLPWLKDALSPRLQRDFPSWRLHTLSVETINFLDNAFDQTKEAWIGPEFPMRRKFLPCLGSTWILNAHGTCVCIKLHKLIYKAGCLWEGQAAAEEVFNINIFAPKAGDQDEKAVAYP